MIGHCVISQKTMLCVIFCCYFLFFLRPQFGEQRGKVEMLWHSLTYLPTVSVSLTYCILWFSTGCCICNLDAYVMRCTECLQMPSWCYTYSHFFKSVVCFFYLQLPPSVLWLLHCLDFSCFVDCRCTVCFQSWFDCILFFANGYFPGFFVCDVIFPVCLISNYFFVFTPQCFRHVHWTVIFGQKWSLADYTTTSLYGPNWLYSTKQHAVHVAGKRTAWTYPLAFLSLTGLPQPFLSPLIFLSDGYL